MNDGFERTKILLSWSGGKDSVWTLHQLRSVPELASAYEFVGLVTAINEVFRRVAIHGFREELLDLFLSGPVQKLDQEKTPYAGGGHFVTRIPVLPG